MTDVISKYQARQDNVSAFLGGLAIGVVTMVAIWVVADTNYNRVTSSLLSHAEHLCRHNDGIEYVHPDNFVQCNNGARFNRVGQE